MIEIPYGTAEQLTIAQGAFKALNGMIMPAINNEPFTPEAGSYRWNTDIDKFQIHDGTDWLTYNQSTDTLSLQGVTDNGNITDNDIIITDESGLVLQNETTGEATIRFVDGLGVTSTTEEFLFNDKNVVRSVAGVNADANGDVPLAGLSGALEQSFDDVLQVNDTVSRDNNEDFFNLINSGNTNQKIHAFATDEGSVSIEVGDTSNQYASMGTGGISFSDNDGNVASLVTASLSLTDSVNTTNYGITKIERISQDDILFPNVTGGDKYMALGVSVNGGTPVNADADGVIDINIQDMPSDFIVTSSIQGFNSLGYSLRYKTDVFRFVNLKPLIPTLTSNITEVLRNGNDLILTANNNGSTTSSLPILLIRLKNCKIVDNVLTWEALYTANLTVNIRVHGATLHRGFLYLQTRPGTGSGLPIQIIKVNPNDLTDTKTLELPVLYGTATDVIGYKESVYVLTTYRATVGGAVDVKFIKIDENLNNYSTVFSYTTSSSGGINVNMHAFQCPFLIYNDEIYAVYTSQLSPTTVSVYVYNFKGEVVRNNTFSISATGVTSTAGYAAHWLTIFNGKLIVSPSDVSVTTGGRWNLLRVDIQTLALEEDYLLPCSVTDDNTMFSDGTLWLNGEGTNYNLTYLMSMSYKNFSGTKFNELNPFGSVGSINTAHLISKEKNKINLSEFNNDIGAGGGGTVTSVTGSQGVTVATGTTTPVIGLGNITPTSVAATGTVNGSNLSGTNTGDNATNTTSNSYADAKVADNLTASTTVAPSKTAVNTGLATKVTNGGDSGSVTIGSTGANNTSFVRNGATIATLMNTGISLNSTLGISNTSNASYFTMTVGSATVSSVITRAVNDAQPVVNFNNNGTTSTGDVINFSVLNVLKSGVRNSGNPYSLIAATSATDLVNLSQLQAASSGYVAKTASYTLATTDHVVDLTTGTATFTLPTAVGAAGKQYVVKNSGTGSLTINTTSSQTIDGATTKSFPAQYSGMRVVSDGSNWKTIGLF